MMSSCEYVNNQYDQQKSCIAFLSESRENIQHKFKLEFENENLFQNNELNFIYSFRIEQRRKDELKIVPLESNNLDLSHRFSDFLKNQTLTLNCPKKCSQCETFLVINLRFNSIWFPKS